MFISASKDSCAKLYDSTTLECLKTYKTDRPVNSASISPKFDHVVLGGGQVTRTTLICLFYDTILLQFQLSRLDPCACGFDPRLKPRMKICKTFAPRRITFVKLRL